MRTNVGTDRAAAMATGLLGWCPLYIPLGIDTSRKALRTETAAPEAGR
jgi:hypothetical protein